MTGPDTENPYAFYAERLKNNPVAWDEAAGCWTIASYAACRMILSDPAAEIPALNGEGQLQLNEDAARITAGLVRLNNPPRHEPLRQVAQKIFSMITAVSIPEIVDELVGPVPAGEGQTIDWVGRVSMKLPVLAIVKGLGLGPGDCEFVLANIDRLVMLMAPDKNAGQVAAINEVAGDLAALSEKAVAALGFSAEARELAIANLLGLIIQSYDAGRGLLSNTLLQVLANGGLQERREEDLFQRSVMETLRWDPPVHHTRRVATQDLVAGGQLIKKGQSIIVMLAAANRDPMVFADPDRYDIDRRNNHEHLTFGAGHHQCLAAYFSIHMTSAAIAHLFRRYGPVSLAGEGLSYEPRWNCRLPKEMRIMLRGLLS